MPGSIHGSLITPGGKLRLHDMDDGGSVMGRTMAGTVGALGSLDEVAELTEDDRTEEETLAFVLPRFSMPNVLSPGHVTTLDRLFNHDYGNLDEEGHAVHAAFNALGNGFKAVFDDETHKTGDLTITYEPLATHLAARGDDPRRASAFTDRKHTKAFKGLHPAFRQIV